MTATTLRIHHAKSLKREGLFIIRRWERYDDYSGLHLTTYVVRDPDGRWLAERLTEDQARDAARGFAERRAAA
ncbi:MAG: hypothetical protein ACR2OE_04115 [Thermomicrobiales bacterium]